MSDLNLKHANPFESLGSLMSALASETRRANTSREFFELAMRDREFDATNVMGDVLALFTECERILQLPFLSEHEPAVESHRNYLKVQRDSFLSMAYSIDSMQACNNFKATWNHGTWIIMSRSVKSFRSEYQNYELIELVKRYLTVIRQFLVDSNQTQTATDALCLLDDLLRNVDEELWKYAWEDFESKFAVLDSLLQTESEKNPGSAFSTFYKNTREAIWTYFIRADRALDVALFVPRAFTVLNFALALCSGMLPLESGQAQNFLALIPQLASSNIESGDIPAESDELHASSDNSGGEAEKQ